MAQVLSLGSISTLVTVRSLLGHLEFATDVVIRRLVTLLETDAFASVSNLVLSIIIRDHPRELTDKLLVCLTPPHIKELSLNGCNRISVNGLLKLTEKCSGLLLLDLNNCDQLISLNLCQSLGQSVKQLTSISFEGCSSVSDPFVQVMILSLHHLKHLNLSSCSSITDIVFLIDDHSNKTVDKHHQYSRLVSVNVSCCSLSSLAIKHLTALCGPTLESIDISQTEISCTALLYLAGYSLLTFVDFPGSQSSADSSDSSTNSCCSVGDHESYSQYRSMNDSLVDEMHKRGCTDGVHEKESGDGILRKRECFVDEKRIYDVAIDPFVEHDTNTSEPTTGHDTADTIIDCDTASSSSFADHDTSELSVLASEDFSLHTLKQALPDPLNVDLPDDHQLSKVHEEDTGFLVANIYFESKSDGFREIDEVDNRGIEVGGCCLENETNDDGENCGTGMGRSCSLARDGKENEVAHCSKQEDELEDVDFNSLNIVGAMRMNETQNQNNKNETSAQNPESDPMKSRLDDAGEIKDFVLSSMRVLENTDLVNEFKLRFDAPVFLCSTYKPKLTSIDMSGICFENQAYGRTCLDVFATSVSLNRLSITWKYFTDEMLMKFIRGSQNLTHLSLKVCNNISAEGLTYMGLECENIQLVDLQSVSFIADDAVFPILSENSLTSLNLCESNITDLSMDCLSKQSNIQLKNLDISLCENLTGKGLETLATNRCSAMLESLVIRHCQFTSSNVDSIARNCRNLRVLDISFASCCDDDGLVEISKHLKHLERLDMSWNFFITDVGLIAILRSCIFLKNLLANGLRELTSEPFLPIISNLKKWRRCQSLLRLKLHEDKLLKQNGDPHLSSDEEFEELYLPHRSTCYVPHLQHISLEYCDSLNDDHLAEIVAICRGSLSIVDYYGQEVQPKWVTPGMSHPFSSSATT